MHHASNVTSLLLSNACKKMIDEEGKKENRGEKEKGENDIRIQLCEHCVL